MWLRQTYKLHTQIHKIYQSQSVEERIQLFKQIQLKHQYQPQQLINPTFLQELSTKHILQFVSQNNIPNNVRVVHALAHIQYNAFMSYADTFFRFAKETAHHQNQFQTEIKNTALEEGYHFQLLTARLKDLGFAYGCMPVIPKLTLAIKQTQHSLIHRLAVISLIHQGKGVRAVQKLIGQLQKTGDKASVQVVRIIQKDELKHFQLGWKWFLIACELQGKDVQSVIRQINVVYRSDIRLPQNRVNKLL